MLKTVKGKVIAGIAVVFLFVGGGVAFGASTAGGNLQTWYSEKFIKSSLLITANTASYVKGKKDILTNEYASIKTKAEATIKATKERESLAKADAINAAKEEHVKTLNGKSSQIETYMDGQFKSIEEAAQLAIKETGEEVLDLSYSDLLLFTGLAGETANETMEKELKDAQGKAVADLEIAIKEAKLLLQGQLDDKAAVSTETIKSMINNKTLELENLISKKKDELLEEQKIIISERALEIENEAKSVLDSVIKEINK